MTYHVHSFEIIKIVMLKRFREMNLCLIVALLLVIIIVHIIIIVVRTSTDLHIISREGWGGRPPTSIENMPNPVPYVVIHHTYRPPACNTTEQCIKAMQWIQDLHQLKNGWVDVGYNFVIGGDGKVYEGRGWSSVGAHAPRYNNQSIGISLIGDWRVELPNQNQLQTAHQLIQMGVLEGKIAADYRLVGHKDVREGTECPGDRLYAEIHTWPHYYHVPNETILTRH